MVDEMKNAATGQQAKHAALKRHVDEQPILTAIQQAEAGTSGALHVSIAERVRGDVKRAAARVFRDLGYGESGSAAVLFFVVPSRRELAVIGGEGIHSRLGDAYWRTLIETMAKRVREEDLTSALVRGVEQVGTELARHFPR